MDKKEIRLRRFIVRHKGSLGSDDFIRYLRRAGFNRFEALDRMASVVEKAGREEELADQLDLVDDIYDERWRIPYYRYIDGKHSEQEWEAKKAQYGYRCIYCGKKPKVLTKDHIVPIKLGGDNSINNIVPACKRCNSRKHAKQIEVFAEGISLKLL